MPHVTFDSPARVGNNERVMSDFYTITTTPVLSAFAASSAASSWMSGIREPAAPSSWFGSIDLPRRSQR
ncbi:hypothetical protein KC336_g56 [Hortaea werneckii]|nr:hypothetical protein KC336_g56 [Hortaea werneckii]